MSLGLFSSQSQQFPGPEYQVGDVSGQSQGLPSCLPPQAGYTMGRAVVSPPLQRQYLQQGSLQCAENAAQQYLGARNCSVQPVPLDEMRQLVFKMVNSRDEGIEKLSTALLNAVSNINNLLDQIKKYDNYNQDIGEGNKVIHKLIPYILDNLKNAVDVVKNNSDANCELVLDRLCMSQLITSMGKAGEVLSQWQEKYEELHKQNDNLNEEFKKCKEEYEGSKKALEDFQEVYDKLKSEVADKKKNKIEIEEKNDRLTKEFDDNQHELIELQTRVDSMKKSIDDTKDKTQQASGSGRSQDVDGNQETVLEQSGGRHDSTSEGIKKGKIIEGLERSCKELKDAIDDKKRENESLEEKISEREERIEQLKGGISELESKVKGYEENLYDLEQKIEVARKGTLENEEKIMESIDDKNKKLSGRLEVVRSLRVDTESKMRKMEQEHNEVLSSASAKERKLKKVIEEEKSQAEVLKEGLDKLKCEIEAERSKYQSDANKLGLDLSNLVVGRMSPGEQSSLEAGSSDNGISDANQFGQKCIDLLEKQREVLDSYGCGAEELKRALYVKKLGVDELKDVGSVTRDEIIKSASVLKDVQTTVLELQTEGQEVMGRKTGAFKMLTKTSRPKSSSEFTTFMYNMGSNITRAKDLLMGVYDDMKAFGGRNDPDVLAAVENLKSKPRLRKACIGSVDAVNLAGKGWRGTEGAPKKVHLRRTASWQNMAGASSWDNSSFQSVQKKLSGADDAHQ